MATGESRAGNKKIVSIGRKALLTVTIVIAACLLYANNAYYRKQAEHDRDHNLRLLSTLTAEVERRIDAGVSFVGWPDLGRSAAAAGFELADCARDVTEATTTRYPEVHRSIEETERGWMVVLERVLTRGILSKRICGTISLDDLLRPIFACRDCTAFDVLLVASADGNVLYSFNPPPTPSAAAPRITRLGALSRRRGFREYVRVDAATLAVGTSDDQVKLGGTDYMLFTQPYTFARSPVSVDRKPRVWILGGLVLASRFRRDSYEVWMAAILILTAIALLAIWYWPFLRSAVGQMRVRTSGSRPTGGPASEAPRIQANNLAGIKPAAPSTDRHKVFISYSHKDKKQFEELKTMLAPAIRDGLVDLWDDEQIDPGTNWKDEIQAALRSTKVAVLLVSQHFLASDFIARHEFRPLLEAAQREGATVFWIYLSSCLYEQTEISTYQAAHDVSKPLDRLDKPTRQAVLSEICAKLIRLART